MRVSVSVLIKSVLTLYLGFYFIRHVDFSTVSLSSVRWPFLGAALLGVWATQWLIAVRWHFMLRIQGFAFSVHTLIRPAFINHLFCQGLPSALGADVYRIMAIKDQVSISAAISGILFERLLGFLGFGCFVMLGALLEWRHIADSMVLWPVLLAVIITIGVFLALLALYTLPSAWCERFWFFAKIAPFVTLLKAAPRQPKALLRAIGTSICITVISVINCALVFLAFEVYLPISQLILIFPMMFIVMSIPISLGGWGVREGILIMALGTYSIPESTALTGSLTYGLLLLLSALPGLWFFLTRPLTLQAQQEV